MSSLIARGVIFIVRGYQAAASDYWRSAYSVSQSSQSSKTWIIEMSPANCTSQRFPTLEVYNWNVRNIGRSTKRYESRSNRVTVEVVKHQSPPVTGTFTLKYTDPDGNTHLAEGMIFIFNSLIFSILSKCLRYFLVRQQRNKCHII